ncbi:MAG: SGNH/GDSL hydrolase family protein [Kiritimatiellae bacterium]|nr:SGNH/GDSL hydrolase family protein [Kiritimatiellia bacterium]MDW8458204.1 SGNH/GDSL hydrolase family protein [Verrucomicrobiota bacterium]
MRRRLAKVVLFLLSLGVGLSIVDTLLARLDPSLEPPPRVERVIRLREHAPNQNRWVRPTREYMQGVDSLERKFYRLATDENGFIMPSAIHETPDIELVFLGGSTTECLYVDETNRFPYLAGRLLESRTGLRINSYNGGHSGNHSMHSLNVLINKVLPMQPDAVILCHNINDFATLLYEGT